MALRLFVEAALTAGESVALPPGAARHAQVRRLQPGDALTLFDGSGAEWPAQVLAMGRSEVQVLVGEPRAVARELPWPVTLALGMPANERMDALVEKATELGVTRVQPMQCERSVLRLAGARAERKREHWQAIAVAACEQCGRARVPVVEPVRPFDDALAALAGEGARILLIPAAAPLREVLVPGPVVALSGPEGGLAPREIDAAHAAGFVAAGLGARVLRADTAPLALLAWLSLAA